MVSACSGCQATKRTTDSVTHRARRLARDKGRAKEQLLAQSRRDQQDDREARKLSGWRRGFG